MAYSETQDLLIGDLRVSAKIDRQKVVNEAAEEIDGKLGFLYALPLAPAGGTFTDLPLHERLILKQINNKLASGRLILTLDIANEGTTLHAYGLRLVTEAMNDLMLIANGTVDLTAVKIVIGGEVRDMAPGITVHDEESAVTMFESHVMRPEHAYWNPGPVVGREAGAV